MVLVLLHQQHCLNKAWPKHATDPPQILFFRLTCCGHGGLLRCIKAPLSSRTPCSLVTRCGPDKRSGRFRRIHAEANLPQNPGPDSTETHDLSSSPNAPIFKLGWPLLLSIALACFLFRRSIFATKTQHQLTPGQAAVAMVSETPHPSTPLQRPAGVSGKHQQQQQQQQVFASISAAGFARLFSGAQRAHLAQLLVYQAQRVSFLPLRLYFLGCIRPPPKFTPASTLHPTYRPTLHSFCYTKHRG